MEEEKSGGGGGDGGVGGESSKVSPKLLKAGDRQLFTVELRPGHTTYVSWKKLVKDAGKVNGSASAPDPPPNAHPNLESRLVPGHQAEKVVKDEPPPNRFSAVIEKIERLYMGKDSSDEEELDNTPDDDQYDTEDSFIDDAELDEYFEVDNSAIKHDGFFVNRGKLERINEPPIIPNQQPKKRRRKDLAKAHGEIDDVHVSSKHVKVAKMAAGKAASLLGKTASNPSQSLSMTSEYGDVKAQNQLNATGISSKKKSTDVRMLPDSSSSLKVSNGNASLSMADVRDTEKLKMGAIQPKHVVSNKLKDVSGYSDALHHKYSDKSAYTQPKPQSGKQSTYVDELEASVRQKEKNGMHEHANVNVSEVKYPMQTIKTSQMHKKDASSGKPKSSMLERAIRELEKMVVESRPPSATENQEADTSSQGVKRRLPREIKLKLAKVAKIAATQGKVSKELINRLMSILGHLIQLRTLKRNLKIMVSMSLSAKEEKDDKFQQIKKEVVEMIKTRVPSAESKAIQQQAGASDDFQVVVAEEKGSLKKRFSMDMAMEEKICDLYDLFVDGLDEDAGPQIRKLYVELAELWPNGLMDNHGIKRAICRAKERRRALYARHKDQKEMRRKKMLAPRSEEIVRAEANAILQLQQMRERLTTDSGSHSLSQANKSIQSTTTAAVRMSSPSMNSPNIDRLKQAKLKATSSINSMDDGKMADGVLRKKKAKRKPEMELEGSHPRLEKLPTQIGEERHKSLKQASVFQQKSNLQLPAPSFNQSS